MIQKYQSIFLGFLTIFCWASLATFGQHLFHLPPFYILALAFFFGSLPSLFQKGPLFPGLFKSLWGIGGFFLYHFCLFYSFRFIPPLKANLINYLWPTLMILFSAFIFKEKLKWFHILGALVSISGCLLLSFESLTRSSEQEKMIGYLLAFGAAVVWPVYTLGRKKIGDTNPKSIGGFCLGTSFLCLIMHCLLEPRVTLQFMDAWKIFLMGIGPFGIGFYTWDLALKDGDSKTLGALSNITPAISTLNLIYFGNQIPGQHTWYALMFILLGSVLGMLDFKNKSVVKEG